MAPFRPTNLNKRAYPGNANVIGPTTQATLGFSTVTCCSSTPSFGACTLRAPLGCTGTVCSCPCCNVCCSCPITTRTPSVPSGIWSSWEQYEANSRCAWVGISTVTGATTCLCCTNVGFACTSAIITNFGGNHICSASNVRWIVAPNTSEVSRTWYLRDDAVTRAQQVSGCTGWFVPTHQQLQNPGFACRTYWDSFSSTRYWGCTENVSSHGWLIPFFNNYGNLHTKPKAATYCVRAFRCVTY